MCYNIRCGIIRVKLIRGGMMNNKKVKSTFFNMTTLIVAGVVLLLLSAVVLLWHGNANSNQAFSAWLAQMNFENSNMPYNSEDY